MTRKNWSHTEWSTRRVVYALLRSFWPAFCLGWDSTRSSSANELQKRRGRILCLLLHLKSLMRSSSPTDPPPKAKEIVLSLSFTRYGFFLFLFSMSARLLLANTGVLRLELIWKRLFVSLDCRYVDHATRFRLLVLVGFCDLGERSDPLVSWFRLQSHDF